MNQLIKNVYTVFENQLEEYNKQRAEKIELAYVGECQNFYVFAGDWRNIFLIDNNGGFEINFKIDEPKTIDDIEVNYNPHYLTRGLKDFNFKIFLKWLYKRNTLVKNINKSNLQIINHIKSCTTKIKSFEQGIEIDAKTGKQCAMSLFSISNVDGYFVETYNYEDKPHCIIKVQEERYRLYLPDKKPKTLKELEIVPDFPFKKEYYKEEIRELKSDVMKFLSRKSPDNHHLNYYELLLLYRAFNPNINVKEIQKRKEDLNTVKQLNCFCNSVVIKYAKQNKENPFKLLTEMYDKGFINEETKIIKSREDFIKEYSYLCDDVENKDVKTIK